MSIDAKLPDFVRLPWRLRMKVTWGTRYRISTFVLGTVVGSLSLVYIPFWLTVVSQRQLADHPHTAGADRLVRADRDHVARREHRRRLAERDACRFGPGRQIVEISRAVCMSPIAR